jgi:hypothetical protein
MVYYVVEAEYEEVMKWIKGHWPIRFSVLQELPNLPPVVIAPVAGTKRLPEGSVMDVIKTRKAKKRARQNNGGASGGRGARASKSVSASAVAKLPPMPITPAAVAKLHDDASGAIGARASRSGTAAAAAAAAAAAVVVAKLPPGRSQKGGQERKRHGRGMERQTQFFIDSACGRLPKRPGPIVGMEQRCQSLISLERNTLE